MIQQQTSLKLLLTNDDGIHAPGLWALYDMLHSIHQVVVIAPDRERSAVGHGITLHQPLRVTEVMVNSGYRGWAVSGTPADCVKLALVELLPFKPDMVIAGINPGANVGINLNYSGTVAAAKEAALYGIPALAVSIQCVENVHYETVAEFLAGIMAQVMAQGLPKGTFLNINLPNLPAHKIAGVCVSRQGENLYDESFDKRQDPRNRAYYWQGSIAQHSYTASDTDGAVLEAGHISITPVKCDMTDYDMVERLKTWDFDNSPPNVT